MLDAWEKCQLPDDLSYDERVNYIFDHPILEPQWWWQDPESGYYQEWNTEANPSRTLSCLNRLFDEPSGLIKRFSHAQIDQGLNLIMNNACSSHMQLALYTAEPATDLVDWDPKSQLVLGNQIVSYPQTPTTIIMTWLAQGNGWRTCGQSTKRKRSVGQNEN